MPKLNYTISPAKKECLLFIHGFLGSMQQWEEISAKFSDGFQVLKIELPGHGNSMDSDVVYSINDLAHSVIQIIGQNNLKRVHLIGHSMGGYVASQVVAQYPERIKSLTMINSIAGPDATERVKNRNRSLKLIDRFKDAFVSMAVGNLFTSAEHEQFSSQIENMKSQAQSISTDAVRKAIVAMRDRKGCLELLDHTKGEIQYIFSDSDEIIPEQRVLNEIKDLKANGHKIKSGHMSILTHPDDIISILKTILAGR